ncbi:MAG: serine hydrolase domain-containing protein [Pseudomonadota bacterium]
MDHRILALPDRYEHGLVDGQAGKADKEAMLRTLTAFTLLFASFSAQAEDRLAPPATVVVAFDSETITPLIVEGRRVLDTGAPIEANDPVRIASISKLIMALATMRLVDEGVVELDTDVSEYLGWQVRSPHHPDAKVTLAQLLSHRSALRDSAGYIIPLGESLEEKLKNPDSWYADAPPGEAPFEYANLGSPLVATVLEAASGTRYDHILERQVFLPLGIENACVNWIGCSDEMVSRAVALYRDTGEPARDYSDDLPPNCSFPVAEGVECTLAGYVPGTNASIFSPQGGVRIGMMDLAKIGQAMLDRESVALPRSMIRAMQGSVADGIAAFEEQGSDQDFFCIYGQGVQVIQWPQTTCQDNLFGDGAPYVGHAGEAYGLRAGLWFAPGADLGVVYFTTQVPPRQSAEDEGGFDPREIALMLRAQGLIAQQESEQPQ